METLEQAKNLLPILRINTDAVIPNRKLPQSVNAPNPYIDLRRLRATVANRIPD
jgi:hypothetical protein